MGNSKSIVWLSRHLNGLIQPNTFSPCQTWAIIIGNDLCLVRSTASIAPCHRRERKDRLPHRLPVAAVELGPVNPSNQRSPDVIWAREVVLSHPSPMPSSCRCLTADYFQLVRSSISFFLHLTQLTGPLPPISLSFCISLTCVTLPTAVRLAVDVRSGLKHIEFYSKKKSKRK